MSTHADPVQARGHLLARSLQRGGGFRAENEVAEPGHPNRRIRGQGICGPVLLGEAFA
ncbi:hypothetical protein [Streptosporangium sp. NPDC051022]|uniref:hypothetical protein n=1 Tax=Streptosporangium sp. NPDC051022 TaxID=3155752 RepID=UPI00343F0BD5